MGRHPPISAHPASPPSGIPAGRHLHRPTSAHFDDLSRCPAYQPIRHRLARRLPPWAGIQPSRAGFTGHRGRPASPASPSVARQAHLGLTSDRTGAQIARPDRPGRFHRSQAGIAPSHRVTPSRHRSILPAGSFPRDGSPCRRIPHGAAWPAYPLGLSHTPTTCAHVRYYFPGDKSKG